MCPERANVLLVEDNSEYRKMLSDFLSLYGHSVLEGGSSVEEAIDIIKHLKEKVNVALIDGNLQRGHDGGGEDGAKVAIEFRHKFPGVPLFGISDEPVDWSDKTSLTKKSGAKAIVEAVTKA